MGFRRINGYNRDLRMTESDKGEQYFGVDVRGIHYLYESDLFSDAVNEGRLPERVFRLVRYDEGKGMVLVTDVIDQNIIREVVEADTRLSEDCADEC
ncbi:MAG: hypothetical protein AABY10_03320 [Nanoarchaeota archaeon]